mmetsp:Transcript_8761/g.26510  ORF Transcript_8761/g.26510 Transcript_8761/m.26510 type:complete len:96 (-) Transcript_8761:38-325(-)
MEARLRKKTLIELRALLKDMGCKASGKKAELVQRCLSELASGWGSSARGPSRRPRNRWRLASGRKHLLSSEPCSRIWGARRPARKRNSFSAACPS